MGLVSAIYRQLLSRYEAASGHRQMAWRAIIELFAGGLAKIVDVGVRVDVHGRALHLPLSHRLPIYTARHKTFDELPVRASAFLRSRDGYLSLIDVGANVGDTISACATTPTDKALAIEANPHFLKFLQKNCGHRAGCRILDVYCSSSEGYAPFEVNEVQGTASIRQSNSGRLIRHMPLDQIVAEHPEHGTFNFLKVDTDGHDFHVLRGAEQSLARNRPAILFECQEHGNARYVEDYLEIARLLRAAGYKQAIFYDNIGYLFSVFDLDRIQDFKFAFLYQLTSPFHFFDVLVMRPEDMPAFLESEMEYYINQMPQQDLRQTARTASQL